MIDAYRDLLAEHDAEVSAAADRFRTRLSQLLAGDQAIEATADGPSAGEDGTGAGRGFPAADEAPYTAPASPIQQPGQGERVPATGRTGPESAPATTPARAAKPTEVRQSPGATFPCAHTGCGRVFLSAQALGTHVTRIHGRQPAQRAVPGAAAPS